MLFLNEVAGGRKLLAAARERAPEASYVVAVAPANRPTAGQITSEEETRAAARSRVEVTLADGSVWRSEPVRRAKGHASRPLDEAETRQKFIACASLTCNPSDAAAHWGRLSSD